MPDHIIILIILAAILALFIWGKYRYDVVAIFGLLATVVTGLVPATKAFTGFASPATITVALVLILSYALTRSGATDFIDKIVNKASGRPTTHIIALAFLAGALSMFINNVAALALFIPIAINSARSANRSLSCILMPLSFGSILGGLVTLIGTPPNIIISSYRQTNIGSPFNMFDFAPVGGTVALIGILFISLVGWRFIRVRIKGGESKADFFEIESYVSEIKVTKDSSLVGKTIKEIEEATEDLDIVLFSLIHKKQRFTTPSQNYVIEKSDILLIEGGPEAIDKFVSKYSLEIVAPEKVDKKILHSDEAETYEVVVQPRSSIEGRLVQNLAFRRRFGVNLLGVSRQGRPYRGRLKSFRINAGDVLLIHGSPELISEINASYGLLPLAERQFEVGRKKYDALFALGIFSVAIALSTFNYLSIQIALAIAVLAMIVLRIIPLREIYYKVDWPIIVLLGAMIPVGQALETSGATALLVDGLLSIAKGLSPIFILAIILIITMTLSDILNNAATAILMAPLALSIAQKLQANPDSFLMAVAVGASCAFLTPIGHQNNALILGPGGYKFGDYWILGLPLEIIIVLVSIPMISIVFPLY